MKRTPDGKFNKSAAEKKGFPVEGRLILGIAGYIGSGKSTVGKYFEKAGACFIDADKVVDYLYKPGQPGYKAVVAGFGRGFLNVKKQISRRKLAKCVFNDRNKLKVLNGLIHPLVVVEIKKMIRKAREKIVVIEASYFEKNGLGDLVDAVIWIDSDPEKTVKRIGKGRRMGVKEIENISAVQKKPTRIEFVLDNGGSKKDLFRQADELLVNIQCRG